MPAVTPAPPGGDRPPLPAAAAARPALPRSLFGEILDWMLAPLLVLWPMSLGLTWVVAQGIASGPFDRELADVALALARQATTQPLPVRDADTAARQALQRAAEPLMRSDESDDDRMYFQVRDGQGTLLAGDALLDTPSPDLPRLSRVQFRDAQAGDDAVRVAFLWLPGADVEDGGGLVQVAETLGKRSRLATEIIKGVILPQFVILPLAVVLVWFALARGIQPLAQLQRRIRQRESTDLSPIELADVPDEVAPLVGSINDLLQRLDRTIATQRHFLADAAHQLKTPLAGLRTQAELAGREIDGSRHDAPGLRHALRQIALSSQRAAHMVNQLLAMARAEAGGEALQRKPVEVAALARGVVRDFVPQALERRIDLGYEAPENAASTRVSAEPVLLGELLRNLVDNALRYTPAGGSVTVRVQGDGGVVSLQVEDTGPGVPAAEREAVFRPFHRGPDTQADGSGLGLAIVQEIAQRHGSVVTLADAAPRAAGDGAPGALFTLRLPALADERDAAGQPAAGGTDRTG